MLTPYLPYPATDGGQIRSFNLIKHLSKKHEITLYSYIRFRDKNQEKDIQVLKKYCRKVEVVNRGKTWTLSNILRTGFSLYPFLAAQSHNNQIILRDNDYILAQMTPHRKYFFAFMIIQPPAIAVIR